MKTTTKTKTKQNKTKTKTKTKQNKTKTNISTGNGNDCCMSCCCMGCTGLGYLFCVKKMRRSMRVKLFLLYLSMLCVTFGVLTGTVFYGPYETNFTATDMRLIKDRLSFIFCDGRLPFITYIWTLLSTHIFIPITDPFNK
jgi:hypothetical protein